MTVFEDGPAMTGVIEIVTGTRRRFVITRATDRGDAVLVTGPDGRIPMFVTEDAAWAFAERAIPPHPDPEVAALERQMTAMLREQSRSRTAPDAIDLDRARLWAARPARDVASPRLIADAWSLLAMGGELPDAPSPDPMWLASIHEGRAGESPAPEHRLRMTVMILEWMVVDANRRTGREGGGLPDVPWPTDTVVWKADDDARLAAALGPAIPALEARFTEDTA